jgi:hypothetical protein
MTKKLCLLSFLLVFVFTNVDAQVTIFAEDFESAAGPENIASPYINWQNGQFTTTPPTNNNYFWIFDNTRCNVISGNYSMAVSINTPVTSGTLPEYRTTRVASTFVYHTTPIDATNFTNLTLDFNWICEGETGFDYGSVLYSLDATNWSTLPGVYQGQNTVQNVTNLDLSVLDGQIFYLAFGWNNDSSLGSFPGFIVDDIDVKGTPLSACTTPNQPTGLNLTPTNNTIIGSFNNAAPIPDNYLVLISTNATPPTPVDGTTYNIGDTIGTGTVVDNDSDTSFTATGLNANTTYYVFVYSYNSLCSGGPTYNVVSPLSGNDITTNSIYCTPLTLNTSSSRYINDVEFLGTLNDVSNLNNGFSITPSGYQDFTASIANSIQAQGSGINIYIGSNNNNGHWKAWVDWNNDGIFSNDASETVYDSGAVATTTTTFGFVVPNNQPIGDYRIRIRFYDSVTATNLYNDFNPCDSFDNTPNLSTPNPNDTIDEYGEAEDYLFTVVQSCTAQIASISEGSTCGPGSATLSVTGNASATDFYWYANETGGSPIATSATFSPNISATTTYWVTATDGSCESLKRIAVTATLNPITELTITPATPIICGSNDVIEIAASGSTEVAYLIDEDFESGGTGVFNVINFINNSPAEDAMTQWQNRTSTFVPNQQVWYPAISSGFGTNQFVMATSDINPSSGYVWTYLESPILDSSNFTDLTLSFDMYFSKYSATSNPDNVLVYVSTDGGTNYNLIQDIDYDVGIGTNFDNINIDLSAYVNEPNLRITIDYYAGWMDGVAIDNVQLFGNRPLNPSFTWTGTVDAYTDAATTIPYTPGSPAASVFVKPTLAQLNMSNFTFTANATLSNGCTINKDITITNNSKIWNGSVNSDWDTAANWSPNGIPTSDNCIYIRNTGTNPIIPSTTDGNGLNLTIENGATLTQQSNSTLTIVNFIDVETGGTYDIEDSASLIQVDDVANTVDGTFTMDRNTNIRVNDYVYWSSPVTSFEIQNVSPGTPNGYKYQWLPFVTRLPGPPGPLDYGEWQAYNSGPMDIGKGYIVKGPTGHPDTPSNFTATFSGTPNNGQITQNIQRSTYTGANYFYNPYGNDLLMVTSDDDNWNLIGNPYPSAIDAIDFLTHTGNGNITGSVYLWTHDTDIAIAPDPFYDDYVYNYDVADYIVYNSSGPSIPNGFNGNIGAGQGFFVLMTDAATTNETVTFDNTMRSSAYANDQFYRTSNPSDMDGLATNRIWLDYVNPSGQSNTTLVAYMDGATNDEDRMFDAPTTTGNGLDLYSLIDEKAYLIQGRQLPFDINDQVPIGLNISESGIQTLAINTLQGLFNNSNQEIYIEDLENSTIHNIKESPYSFTSESGIINDRFILRFTNTTLGLDDFDTLSGISVFEDNDKITVKSDYSTIASIEVYDVLGRVLFFNKTINSNRYSIESISPNNATLLLKIKLADGKQKIAKIIF